MITTNPAETWRPTVKHRLYDLVKPFSEFFNRAIYRPKFNDWCRTKGTATPVFPDRYTQYQYLIDNHGLGGPIDFLEFGVFQGDSLRWWLKHNSDPASRFVGFDTFTGLPESWVGLPPGTFSAGGQLPDFNDSRVSLEIGLFQDTLGGFLERFPLNRKTVIHLDADLYSATLYVLTMLMSNLKQGDIILFDEIGSAYGVTHEFRALCDVEAAFGLRYRVLAGADRFVQAAMELQ
jgi:hypothetical protein